jgi:hypothetical protein
LVTPATTWCYAFSSSSYGRVIRAQDPHVQFQHAVVLGESVVEPTRLAA